MHDGRGKNHQAYLWQYGRPGGSTIFEFRLGRDREGPKQFLGNFEGILQSDGYAAYNQVGGPKIVYAACWAHARRKFIDALKLNALDKEIHWHRGKDGSTFRVDRVARERGLTLEARHVLRNEESRPILERIKVSIEAARIGGLPQSVRTKACEYTLKLWNRLTRFLDHPELELSNNATENSMRRWQLVARTGSTSEASKRALGWPPSSRSLKRAADCRFPCANISVPSSLAWRTSQQIASTS